MICKHQWCHRLGRLWIPVMVLGIWAQQAAGAEAVRVMAVRHDAPALNKRRVRIELAQPAVFNVFRLNQPMRVVIDIADGQLAVHQAPQVIEDGILEQIGFRQFTSKQVQIARVTIVFAQEHPYKVVRDGHAIVVEVESQPHVSVKSGHPSPWSLAAALEERQAKPKALEQEGLDGGSKEAFAQGQANIPPPSEQAVPPEPSSPIAAPLQPLEQEPNKPSPTRSGPNKGQGRLVSFQTPNDLSLQVRIKGQLAYQTMTLRHPDRFVIDFPGITRAIRSRKSKPNQHQAIRNIRLGDQPEGTRMVLDLQPGASAPTVRQQGNELLLAFAPPASLDSLPQGQLRQMAYVHSGRQKGEIGTLMLEGHALDKAHMVAHSPKHMVLRLPHVEVGTAVPRTLDLSAYKSALEAVEVQVDERDVLITVDVQQEVQATLRPTAQGLAWHFAAKQDAQVGPMEEEAPSQGTTAFVAANVPAQQAGLEAGSGPLVTDPAPSSAQISQGEAERNGEDDVEVVGGSAVVTLAGNKRSAKRISIDVKDADIVNVLRLISEETGENIVASDDVRGKITLKLRNVPADQALDTMLRTKGFDKVRHHNILRIAPAESIQKERDLELLRKRSLAEVEETIIKMVTVNYAAAKEIVDQVKPMLTSRGTVQVDERTNTIIVQEVASNVDRLVELTRRLDRQTPLVMIQARIVEAQVAYAQELGIQWGGTAQRAGRLGNPTGLMFPADVLASGAADNQIGNQVGGVATPARFAVNLPANLGGAGGGIGLILGSAGGGDILNLRLTAMENNGNGKIISSPEVATLDNKTARISQGVKIPISVVSAAGTNTRFVDAKLELEVTPHVTNDGTVLMKISTKKSEPDFANRGAAGDPTIREKSAETEVLVRDGDTSVIGGIYTRTTSENSNEIPFLSRIPLLGLLFKRHAVKDERAELLVFITPRIINRDESIVSGQVLTSTPLAVSPP